MDVATCKQRMPLPEIWRALGLRGEPRKSCKSPFREERTPSFSVFQHDGMWFWKDHANGLGGDEVDLIMLAKGMEKGEALRWFHEAAGVTWVEKVAPKSGGKIGKIVATYDYLSEDGRLLHQTVRFEPKSFRQRRPAVEGMRQGEREAKRDRDGRWWLWSLEGIRPVLYRLPELMSRRDEEVWLTEGEKDADALAAQGLLATTCPMGARKWRPWHTEALAGRKVVLCGDADAAGQAHVEMVGKLLVAAGCEVDEVNWDDVLNAVTPGRLRE